MPLVDHALIPLLLTILLFVGIAPSLRRTDNRARALLAGAAILLQVRYIVWRWTDTVRPIEAEWSAGYVWTWLYFATEAALIAEAVVFFVLMSRTIDRSAEADEGERWVRARAATRSGVGELPTVDVFIPTYNEGWDVLEKTVVGACALDYPRVRVHVLDDGAREWLREQCDAIGVQYIVRPDRRHAKAGNVNHALGLTDGDLVLVLDADFVPRRDFLARTVGFFRDPTVGVAQVPHHFFNSDPLQANLGLHQRYADDQEFFFRDLMPARDAWGVAFSCGSNSVNRRVALEAIGGLPTSSVTEDMLSSLVLLQHGYRTVYLNERLARGLAPEGLSAMYTQRARWARGGVQMLYIPQGPLRARGLRPLQRLFFLPLGWVTTYLGLPVMVLGPILFLWFGLVGVHEATAGDLLSYQMPMLLAALAATPLLSEVKRNPIIALAYQLFLSFRLAPAVLHSIVRPFAVGFQVTPKGALASRGAADVRAVTLSVAVIVATVVGIVANELPAFQRVSTDAFLTPSVAWGAVTVSVMLVCLMMSYDFPRRRQEERFVIEETHAATLGLGHSARRVSARVLDLALGGAAVRMPGDVPGEPPPVGSPVTLHLAGVGDLPGRVVRHISPGLVGMVFDPLAEPTRWYLVAKIFTHAYENYGKHVSAASAVRALVARLVGLRVAGTVRAHEIAGAAPTTGLRPNLRMDPDTAYPRLCRRDAGRPHRAAA